MVAEQLTRALERLAIPIYGVRIVMTADRATWQIDYKPAATVQQRLDGEALKATFDLATDPVFQDEQADATVEGAKAAIAVGAAVFKAITGSFPTPAQRQQIKLDAKTVWKLL